MGDAMQYNGRLGHTSASHAATRRDQGNPKSSELVAIRRYALQWYCPNLSKMLWQYLLFTRLVLNPLPGPPGVAESRSALQWCCPQLSEMLSWPLLFV